MPVAASLYTDKMYCTLYPDGVQIALQQEEWAYLCTQYLQAVNTLLKKNIDDLLTVQSYISRGQDAGYRMEVRELLRDRFLYIDGFRKNIEYTMSLFENNIFKKLQDYFRSIVAQYYFVLQEHADDQDPDNLPEYYESLTEQIQTIEAAQTAESFDVFLPLLQKYLYLRRELTWKFEL